MEEKETLKLCEKMLEEFQKENIKGAFDLARPHTVVPDDQITQLSVQGTQQLEIFRQMYGGIVGYELIKKNVLKSLIRYVFILKTQKIPIFFIFIFYNAKKDWKIIGIEWKEGAGSFFEREKLEE